MPEICKVDGFGAYFNDFFSGPAGWRFGTNLLYIALSTDFRMFCSKDRGNRCYVYIRFFEKAVNVICIYSS